MQWKYIKKKKLKSSFKVTQSHKVWIQINKTQIINMTPYDWSYFSISTEFVLEPTYL